MYGEFALVYDRLMTDVPYDAWALRLHELLRGCAVAEDCLTEMGCGTGSMTLRLAQLGYRIDAYDPSCEMLAIADHKAREAGVSDAICFRAGALDRAPLDLRSAGAILCICDVMNYVMPARWAAVLRRLHGALRPGGLLLFDMSTPWKFRHLLAGPPIFRQEEDLTLLWHNRCSADFRRCTMDLELYCALEEPVRGETLYRRIWEKQTQYTCPPEEMISLLLLAGFSDVCVYDGYAVRAVRKDSRRALFTATV